MSAMALKTHREVARLRTIGATEAWSHAARARGSSHFIDRQASPVTDF